MTLPDGNPRITFKEVLELGVAEGTLKRRLIKREWETIVIGTARNGKPVREILVSSLPSDLQLRWQQKHSRKTTATATNTCLDDSTGPTEDLLTAALRRYDVDERAAFLNEAQRLAEIILRYDDIEVKRQRVCGEVAVAGSSPAGNSVAVRQLVDGHTPADAPFNRSVSAGFEFVPAVITLCNEASCTNEIVLAREPRRAQAPSPHTLDRWSRQFKQDGLLTFLRASAKPISETDRRKAVISSEAVEWVNEHWQSCPTARALYSKLKKLARKHGWKIPSESWVYRKWASLPKPVKTLVLKGEKAYVSTCAPYVPRDYSDLDALQILVGDHSQRDVTVRLRDGSLVRPWLTLWQCLRTGLLWGWHLDLVPSSRTVGLAYANGVRTFGAQPISRPDDQYYSYLYTDQGKDYKSRNIDGKVIEVHKGAMLVEGGLEALRIQRRVGLLDDLGLKHLVARGYNAREKMIERTHRVISDWEQSTFDVEYCGRDSKSKPDAWHHAYQRHVKLSKRAKRNHLLLNDSPFMSLDDYRDALTGFIAEYNHTEHQRSTLGGAIIVPIDEYHRLYTTHYTISEESLALFLMKVEKRKVTKNGVWLHQRNWWYLNKALWEYKDGTEVEVRYSEDDYSRCWVVAPDGKIIESELVTPTSVLNPNKATMKLVAEAAAHERKVIREFSFITQSQIRGESVEDRVAALIQPQEEVEAIAVAGGQSNVPLPSARVHSLTRMDQPKIRAAKRRQVTPQDVSTTVTDADIFRPSGEGRVKEFDFDDE